MYLIYARYISTDSQLNLDHLGRIIKCVMHLRYLYNRNAKNNRIH